jgi:hypothetical protein
LRKRVSNASAKQPRNVARVRASQRSAFNNKGIKRKWKRP